MTTPKFLLAAAMLLLGFTSLFSQRAADWKTELPCGTNEIFFHTLTGVPIVRGDDCYAGIDVKTKSVKWQIKRSKMNATMAKLGNEETLDFFEINNSPYAVSNNTIVDTRDGKILLDPEADAYKTVKEYELLPGDKVLVTTEGKSNVSFHLIDLTSNSKVWSSDLFKVSGGLGRFVTSSSSDDQPKPVKVQVEDGTTVFAQNSRLMIIQKDKEVAFVKAVDGSVLWKNKMDPARIFFSPDEKIAYLVEHDKGGMIAQAMSAGTKRMGNEIYAVEVETGKELWKKPLKASEVIRWYSLEGDKLWVVNAKGCNVYNTSEGTAIWKSDFSGKRIQSID
ncbi:MAG: PQQ-like beta-propeller repeat protein, partial [Saprospiraceae bacterium]|nr:PQQ-like beta-propeller repeat protein [Saprospiraceae bacterium]